MCSCVLHVVDLVLAIWHDNRSLGETDEKCDEIR